MSVRDIAQVSYDVIVVGARCAGAATAMLLARAGLRVVVVDRGRAGTDTLSTHALMRGGVLQLARWGVLPDIVAAGTPPIRVTTFHYEDEVIRVPIKARDGVDALYAPRRTVLDAAMANAAGAAGAELVYGVTAGDVVRDGRGRVNGLSVHDSEGGRVTLRAGLVVGADGLRSTIAAHVNAPATAAGRHASGVLFAYWDGLPDDGNHWHYRASSSAGVIPTNGGQTCVFAAMPERRFDEVVRGGIPDGYRRLVAEAAPELAALLPEASMASSIKGFAPEPGFMRQAWGPGWALVGDAGYFRDPLTAHGITDAFRDAELLARAILAGGDQALAEYQTLRDEYARGVFDATDFVASFDWSMEALQARHRVMSDEMNREVAMLRALEPPGERPGASRADLPGAGTPASGGAGLPPASGGAGLPRTTAVAASAFASGGAE